jgi:hypothetical protein
MLAQAWVVFDVWSAEKGKSKAKLLNCARETIKQINTTTTERLDKNYFKGNVATNSTILTFVLTRLCDCPSLDNSFGR